MTLSVEEMNTNISLALNQLELKEFELEDVLKLIRGGVNVNAADNEGHTALIIASTNGCTEVVQALLAHGANIYATDNRGSTALIIASKNGCTEIVKLIKQAQEEKIEQYKTAHTYLTFAIQHPALLSAGVGLLVAAAVVATIMTCGVAPVLAAATGLTATAATYATAATAGLIASTATFFSMPNNLSAHVASQGKHSFFPPASEASRPERAEEKQCGEDQSIPSESQNKNDGGNPGSSGLNQ